MHPNHTVIPRAGGNPGRCSFDEAAFPRASTPFAGYLADDLCDRPAAYTITLGRVRGSVPVRLAEADLCVEHTAHVRACSTCIDSVAIRTFRAPA